MTRTLKTLLGVTLTLGLLVPGWAQDALALVPAPGLTEGKPGKPVQTGKPTQGQVVIGVIQQVNAKQHSILVKPVQGGQIQYQAPVKPDQFQGQKSADEGVTVLITDSTAIQGLEGKGLPAPSPDQGPKVKPTPVQTVDQGPKVKPAPVQTQTPDQGSKVKPAPVQTQTPDQGPKVKPGPAPAPEQFTQLQVGQTVRVVYQEQGGKAQAQQVRVIQAQTGTAPAVAPTPSYEPAPSTEPAPSPVPQPGPVPAPPIPTP